MTNRNVKRMLAKQLRDTAAPDVDAVLTSCQPEKPVVFSHALPQPKRRPALQLVAVATCMVVAALAITLLSRQGNAPSHIVLTPPQTSTLPPVSSTPIQTPTATPTPTPTVAAPAVFDEHNADFQTLLTATEFTYRASDAQPDAPETVNAFARLYALPNAREYFETLEQTGTTAGKMYALCGLYLIYASIYDPTPDPTYGRVYDPAFDKEYEPTAQFNPEINAFYDKYRLDRSALTIVPNRYGEDTIADLLAYETINLIGDGELPACILAWGQGERFVPTRDPMTLNQDVFRRFPGGATFPPTYGTGGISPLPPEETKDPAQLWEEMPYLFSAYFKTHTYPGTTPVSAVRLHYLPNYEGYIAVLYANQQFPSDETITYESFVYLYKNGTITPLRETATQNRGTLTAAEDGQYYLIEFGSAPDGSQTQHCYRLDGTTLVPSDKTYDESTETFA